MNRFLSFFRILLGPALLLAFPPLPGFAQNPDPSVKVLFSVSADGSGNPPFLDSLAIDGDLHFYVVKRAGNSVVEKYGRDGKLLFQLKFEDPQTHNPTFVPLTAALDASGNLYVLGQNEVLKYSRDGKFLARWGKTGVGDGEFLGARRIIADPKGRILVLDPQCWRVQEFDQNGKFLRKWGIHGPGPGEFGYPIGFTFDPQGNLYMVDPGKGNKVMVFDGDRRFLREWTAFDEPNRGWNVQGVAMDRKGTLYLANDDKIQRFDTQGRSLGDWVLPEQRHAYALAYFASQDKLYASNVKDLLEIDLNRMGSANPSPAPSAMTARTVDIPGALKPSPKKYKRMRRDGTPVPTPVPPNHLLPSAVWTGSDNSHGYFLGPTALTVGPDGRIYVADGERSYDSNTYPRCNRVQVFDGKGRWLETWGEDGSGDGQTWGIQSLALDGAGNRYVLDGANSRVQKFDAHWKFLAKTGGPSIYENPLAFPRDIAVDATGRLFVAEYQNYRILVFNQDLKQTRVIGGLGMNDGEFDHPLGLALDGQSNLYVVDDSTRIQKFSPEGQFLAKWSKEKGASRVFAAEDGRVYWPQGVKVDWPFPDHVSGLAGIGADGKDLSPLTLVQGAQDDLEPAFVGGEAVYAIDHKAVQIVKFDMEGKETLRFGKPLWQAPGQIHDKAYLAWGPGNLLYAVGGSAKVVLFDRQGRFVKERKLREGESKVGGLGFDGKGNGYFLRMGEKAVVEVYDPSGRFVAEHPLAELQEGFNYGAFAVGGDGGFFVTDQPTKEVICYGPGGKVLARIKGVPGKEPFNPQGLAVDPQGRLWVSDANNDVVRLFGKKGKYIRAMKIAVGENEWEGSLHNPGGLAFDGLGHLVIIDGSGEGGDGPDWFEAKVYTLEGKYLATLESPLGFTTQSVCADGKGNLYVFDGSGHRILKYDKIDKDMKRPG